MITSLNQLSIIGLGNQAKSWALNLTDSGLSVSVGVRKIHENHLAFTKQHPRIQIVTIDEQWISNQTHLALLIPDDQHLPFLQRYASILKHGTVLIYAHGFSETAHHLSRIFPQFHHALLAPKAIASELRAHYLSKSLLAAVYAITTAQNCTLSDRENLKNYILHIAKNLGITWGPFCVTFEQECKADLFSEQTLLCNLLPEVLGQCFSTLVEKKIPWELAFCEVFLELKLIVNALEAVGPKEFYKLISPNALVGSQHYVESWKNEGKFKVLFEKCWDKLDSGEMINLLNKTKPDEIRDNVLKKWERHPLTLAYNNFLKEQKDLSNGKN